MRRFLLILLVASTAQASPILLSHQGYLLGSDDVAVNGPHAITLRVWKHPTASAANQLAWTDTFTAQPFMHGLYTLVIGDTSIAGHEENPLDSGLFASDVYLGVSIDGSQELLPRQRVTAVPNAGIAQDALALGGVAAAQFLQRSEVSLPLSPTGTASTATFLRGDGSWQIVPPAGEVNTASNVGSGGVGLFAQKVGADLQFRGISAGSSRVSVAVDAPNNTVAVDVVEANLRLDHLGGSVPVAQGGTGATDAAGARTAFGLGQGDALRLGRLGLGMTPDTNAALVAAGQIFTPRYMATTNLNWNQGNVQSVTLANGANTLTFANPGDGAVYRLIVKQPASGAAGTLAASGWPASAAWPGGAKPTLTATNGAVDLFTFVYDASTGRYYGTSALNESTLSFLSYTGATHTPEECTLAGGTVTAVTGDGAGTQVCRFETATCPSGWAASGWRMWAARQGAAAAEQLTVVGPCTFITYSNGCGRPTKRIDIPASAWGLNVAAVSCTTSSPVNTCDGACYGGACVSPLLSETIGAVGCF